MNIRLNPILKKDLRVTSRTMKFSWGIFIFEAFLGIIFLFAMAIIYDDNLGYTGIYKEMVALFPIIGGTELGIVALIMPIMTATAITQEREKQTFDILLTTVMTPMAIIRGKVLSAVARVMMFIIASIPLMAISFTVGGIGWSALFIYLISTAVFAFYVGSLGILCSTLSHKSIASIIIAYAFYGVIFGGTYMPMLIVALFMNSVTFVFSALLLMLNPITNFTVFFSAVLAGDDLNDLLAGASNQLGLPFTNAWVWFAVANLVMLGMGVFFQKLAARRIEPVKRKFKNKGK